jgi:hypothetical protein
MRSVTMGLLDVVAAAAVVPDQRAEIDRDAPGPRA